MATSLLPVYRGTEGIYSEIMKSFSTVCNLQKKYFHKLHRQLLLQMVDIDL